MAPQDRVTVQLTISASDAQKIFRQTHVVSCKGALGKLENPMSVIVEPIHAPRSGFDDYAECYVTCPRLISVGEDLRCYEGSLEEIPSHHSARREKQTNPCPYYRPQKRR